MDDELELLKKEVASLKSALMSKTTTGPKKVSEEERAQIDEYFATKIAPLNSVSLMPDGKFYNREELMVQLGLNPNIGPEAWICVAGCGSNSVAANLKKNIRTLPWNVG